MPRVGSLRDAVRAVPNIDRMLTRSMKRLAGELRELEAFIQNVASFGGRLETMVVDVHPMLKPYLTKCDECRGLRVEQHDSQTDTNTVRLVDPNYSYCDNCRSTAVGFTKHVIRGGATDEAGDTPVKLTEEETDVLVELSVAEHPTYGGVRDSVFGGEVVGVDTRDLKLLFRKTVQSLADRGLLKLTVGDGAPRDDTPISITDAGRKAVDHITRELF